MRVTRARVFDWLAAGDVVLRMDLALGSFRALLGGGVTHEPPAGAGLAPGQVECGALDPYKVWAAGAGTGLVFLPAAVPLALLQSPFHAATGLIF